MGSRLFSNTTGLYGGSDYTNEAEREKVAKALKIDSAMLPTKPTIPYNQIIEKAISGEIKALWIIATNPMHSWVNNSSFKKAVENLDLFIVQDIYDDTHSAVYADIMLPAASALKKEGFLINTERRLTGLQPVLEKQEGEKDDFDIFLGVGKALGMGCTLDVWRDKKNVFEVLRACTEGLPCDISGIEIMKI